MKLYTLGYLRKDGKTLMIHRSKQEADGSNSGKWNGIGGSIEENELAEYGFKREVYEETGLTIKNIRRLGTLMLPRFVNGEDTLIFIYESNSFEGKELTENHEGTLHWVEDKEILNRNLWDADKKFLKIIAEGKTFSMIQYFDENKELVQTIHEYATPEEYSII